jgi:hypothetical protein
LGQLSASPGRVLEDGVRGVDDGDDEAEESSSRVGVVAILRAEINEQVFKDEGERKRKITKKIRENPLRSFNLTTAPF